MKKYRIIKITTGTGDENFYIQERKTVFFFFPVWRTLTGWSYYDVNGYKYPVWLKHGVWDFGIARGVLKYLESEEEKRRLSNLVIKIEVIE